MTSKVAAEVDASQTTGGSTNGRGSLMLNFPIGDIAALRFVTTDKYISGFIHRYVIAPGQFPYPTNFGNCGGLLLYSGRCSGRTRRPGPREFQYRALHFIARILAGSAERCSVDHRQLHVSAHRRRRIQQLSGPAQQRSDLSTLRYQGAVLRFFPYVEPEDQLRHVVREPDLGVVLLEARCLSIDGFDRSPAEHLQLHAIHPEPLPGQRYDVADRPGTAAHVAG